MGTHRKRRYGWTAETWAAYKWRAMLMIEQIIFWAANTRAVEAMMERED